VAGDTAPKKWDVFISYASEDKAELAIPLAETLRNEGLRVWFDRFELRPGDSVSRSIEEGLANSSAGVIILSSTSLRKNWTNYEIAALKQLYINFGTRIIPIWKEIGVDELKLTAPGLLDLRSLSTSEFSLEEMAYEIIAVVSPATLSRLNAKSTWKVFRETALVQSIPLKDLKRSHRQRQKLSAQSLSRIRVLHSVFYEVLQDDIETWIDNFCRDLSYEEEILFWELTAALFLDWISAVGSARLSKSERNTMYEVIFKLTSGFSNDDVERTLMKLPRRHIRCFSEIADAWTTKTDLIEAYSTSELANHPTITRKFDNLRKRR
jgi:hypothetical protein